jgi:hypothetical protein
MSTGSWFKAHRRSLITHTSIVMIFILFIIFLSEPLFDRLEAVQGESKLHSFPLPTETGGITYSFDNFEIHDQTTLEVRGWVFINDQDSENTEVYIVLKSASKTYIFDTMTEERLDVTRHFEEIGLNLDHSGFTALIPIREIANNEYNVGIYVTKDDSEALQYTDRTIIRSGDTVETE